MAAFRIHPRLAADCHRLGRLALSDVLLHRDAALPWLILVPRVDAIELCDLTPGDRSALEAEIDGACALIRKAFPATTKLNVAAIGNLVPQLHVHVIGRHPGDACWPGVVWGKLDSGSTWPENRVRELAAMLAAASH
jgi:diadenosine tetraphosphate (Ap4A) HIT family hydrolase